MDTEDGKARTTNMKQQKQLKKGERERERRYISILQKESLSCHNGVNGLPNEKPEHLLISRTIVTTRDRTSSVPARDRARRIVFETFHNHFRYGSRAFIRQYNRIGCRTGTVLHHVKSKSNRRGDISKRACCVLHARACVRVLGFEDVRTHTYVGA